MIRTLAILLLLAAPAMAQGILTGPPTEEDKANALRAAFTLNGNSMNGWGRMVDLTDPQVLEQYALVRQLDAQAAVPLEFPPMPKPRPEKVSVAVTVARADICRRHGKRRVTHGRSWRCK